MNAPRVADSLPLKYVTTLVTRGTAPDYSEDGKVRVVGQAANRWDRIIWSNSRLHNHNGPASRLKGYLRPHDILVNSTGTGTLGRVGYFTGSPDGMECIADGHVTVIRAEPSYLDPRYLYYQLSSQQFYDYVYSALVVGATNQIELNREKLMGARIRIPALDEQRRIADFLDAETARIDDLRRLTQEQLALLEERLLQLTRELTTGQTTSKRPTGIPWMPFIASSWRLGKVAHLFQTGSGTTPTASNSAYFDGGLPWINSADLHDGHIVGTSRSISRAAVRDFPALKEHPVGSLVVAMYGQGETKGRVGILDIPAFVNQACCVLIPTEVLTSDYASYWFRGHKNGIASLALGAGQPNLSQDLIRELRMPVPGEEAQRELVSRLTQAESLRGSQRNALLRRNSLLAERRQALITAAVTGQFDVTTAHGVDVP